jgi:hypothetical protein
VQVGTESHCRLPNNITANLALPAGPIYQLNGRTQVGTDVGPTGAVAGAQTATLTIAAGARIYAGTRESVLIVARGSRINAQGTVSQPIIFTSAYDLGYAAALGLPNASARAPNVSNTANDPNTGEWGGIVLNGRAPINLSGANASTANCPQSPVNQSEGEGNSGCYGGDLTTDNSGTLSYVQIRYGGFPITAVNELNTLALQGVGSGTTLDHIQAHNGGDDGIEFFGGSVNAKFLVITGADDDSLDWTFGYNGKIQYVIVYQNPLQNSDNGYEADNNEFSFDASPRANPIISNATIVGENQGDSGNFGVLLRRGTAARLYNHVIGPNFTPGGLDVDDASTFARFADNTLQLRSWFIGNNPPFVTDSDNTSNNLANIFTQQSPNNRTGTSTLLAVTTGGRAYINGANESGVMATDPRTLDPFFDPVTYIGAVQSSAFNWTIGWTTWLNA